MGRQRVVIIGAGPAGLTAAYELLSSAQDYEVTVLEETDCVGGISRTVNYRGNRMDMGGHRFFSKIPRVNEWWERMLPMQGSPASDDVRLNRDVPLHAGGPDPDHEDRVMLVRHRVSRILFDGSWFDYPISLKPSTLRAMGVRRTMAVGMSYLASLIHKLPETNLENFYINRFGRKLYSMFFESYTENLWGRHPRDIDASWGAQRVKGLSIAAVIRDLAGRAFHVRKRHVETSLIEQFKYPKLGPGELWEVVARQVEGLGGTILMNSPVTRVHRDGRGSVTSVEYASGGESRTRVADILISSMPLKDLVLCMDEVPDDPLRIARGLPYRDYMTLGVLVSKERLTSTSKIVRGGSLISDNWVYVQDASVRMGRFQVYNNWSPYLVDDVERTIWLGLEYFVTEGDELWCMDEEAFSRMGIGEMKKIGLIDGADQVLDTHLERVKKAYPAYFDTYDEMPTLVAWLKTIPNLYCVGRNGQHRYNNIDHSMMTSFEAVTNIIDGIDDKSNIWAVNTEKEYHEGGQGET